jgi:putative addiction module CopG family antidote
MAITLELSPEIERLIGEKVRSGEFRSADELVRQAVLRFIDDETAIAVTEALLQEAADSGDYIDLTESEWDKIEQEALEEARRRLA